MKATLRPRFECATTEYPEVELLGRTGNRKIKIRRGDGTIYAVERFYLYDPSRRRRLGDDEFAALPWQGKGDDPDAAGSERNGHGAGSRASERAAACPIAPFGTDR